MASWGWGAARWAGRARGRGGGRRCQRRAASGMQRPEAWPRPHPGEGAAAAQAGGAAPPARAGEPAGSRVRSRRAGARVRGAGIRAGVGLSWGSQLTTRTPGAGNLVPPLSSAGRGPGRAGEKKFPRAWTLQEACPESPRGAEVLGQFRAAMETAWGWGGLRFCREGEGARRGGGRMCVLWSPPASGGWGRAQRARPASPRAQLEEEAHRCPPRPRFCDTLRLGLCGSQCMTELGPGRTFRTQRAARPPGACSGTSAGVGGAGQEAAHVAQSQNPL